MTMELGSIMLKKLSANHTVILFDNRGVGATTANGNRSYMMEQLANDFRINRCIKDRKAS